MHTIDVSDRGALDEARSANVRYAPPGVPAYDLRAMVRRTAPRLRLVALLATLSAGVTSAVILLTPETWVAPVVMTTVSASRSGLPLSGAASLLAGGLGLNSGGLTSTPAIVSYLLTSRSVLDSAARQDHGGRWLAEAVTGDDDLHTLRPEAVVRELRRPIRVTHSKETGFIALQVQSRDSSAARALAERVVALTQRTFIELQQSQARQLRAAQERRLDSARRVLRAAEDRLLAFEQQNRVIPPNSHLSYEHERLNRVRGYAQQAYEGAMTDNQTALARELENVPAVVVVEGPPAILPAKERQTVLRSLLVFLVVAAAGFLSLLARELLRSEPESAA